MYNYQAGFPSKLEYEANTITMHVLWQVFVYTCTYTRMMDKTILRNFTKHACIMKYTDKVH